MCACALEDGLGVQLVLRLANFSSVWGEAQNPPLAVLAPKSPLQNLSRNRWSVPTPWGGSHSSGQEDTLRPEPRPQMDNLPASNGPSDPASDHSQTFLLWDLSLFLRTIPSSWLLRLQTP